MTADAATRVGRGRRRAKAGGASRHPRRARAVRWSSSLLSEKPVPQRPRILGGCLNLTGARGVHSALTRVRISKRCLRESCMRETRTCSLSGGRRPAPSGAPPPTRQVQGRQGVALPRPDVVRPSPASPLPSPRSSHIPCRITAFRLSCEVSETFHSGNSFGNRTPLPRLRLPSSCRGPLVFLEMRVVSHSVTSGPPITPPVLRPAPSAGSRNPVAPYAVVRYRVP